eukprot:TRINITY_DN6335_c0_g1_i2.p1 TRINITY_DN6335_c0_g1~~TRINITY_DN6335_c0_g1_i2.p1  ORF type:complete len:519 (-),score=135.08 TRINITY_DN6335_c0_g1_i2:10-1566(-)
MWFFLLLLGFLFGMFLVARRQRRGGGRRRTQDGAASSAQEQQGGTQMEKTASAQSAPIASSLLSSYSRLKRVESASEIEESYEFFDTLGKGAFSEVVLCRNKASGVEYAAKIVSKNPPNVNPKDLLEVYGAYSLLPQQQQQLHEQEEQQQQEQQQLDPVLETSSTSTITTTTTTATKTNDEQPFVSSLIKSLKDSMWYITKTLSEEAIDYIQNIRSSSSRAFISNWTCKLEMEIFIMSKVNHPNIIHLEEVFETADHFYLMMEKLEGGELFEQILLLDHYSERDARTIITQIIKGVKHLHENNIVHRDIKPENIMLVTRQDSGSPLLTSSTRGQCLCVKIIDFGLSLVFPNNEAISITTAAGSPGYIAPEIYNMMDTGVPYGKECDCWSVGCILYILLCGFPPFYGDNNNQLIKRTKEGFFEFPSPYWDHITDSAKDLVTRLLIVDPSERISAEEALVHPWIQSGIAEECEDLASMMAELRKFNARRKFRGAVGAVKLVNRMAAIDLTPKNKKKKKNV